MTHNPKNTECVRNIHNAQKGIPHSKCDDTCTCEKQQQSPTSVTGDEWRERFEKRGLVCAIRSASDFNQLQYKLMLGEMLSFMTDELKAQRTHIKQALLGRSKKLKRKYSNDLALDENSLIHKLETVDDTELFINEELA